MVEEARRDGRVLAAVDPRCDVGHGNDATHLEYSSLLDLVSISDIFMYILVNYNILQIVPHKIITSFLKIQK